MPRFTIHDLAETIDARAAAGGEGSYTRKLLDKGAEHCTKKFGEEAVETVIAAVENDRAHLIAESADLLYHFLVLLKARGVKLEEVEAALDDTNLQRLLLVFEELRESSQLIVITHQRRTMEAADALYGITMRGDGVSAVISQQLATRQPA